MKHIFTFLILSCSLTLFAQPQNADVVIDQRLYEVYEASYLETIKTNNPILLQRWNFYLDHAAYITDIVAEKEYGTLPTVSISNPNNFNIIQLEKEQKIHKDWKMQRMYKIEGTNKVLVYYSGKQFIEKFNESRKS